MDDLSKNCSILINDDFEPVLSGSDKEDNTVNWIKLKYEMGCYYPKQILQHCKLAEAGTDSSVEKKSVDTLADQKLQPFSANTNPDFGKRKLNTKVENSQNEALIRLEAAIVRFMKRTKFISSIDELYTVITNCFAERNARNEEPDPINVQLATINMSDFKNVVAGLEKRSFVRTTTNGNIYYEF